MIMDHNIFVLMYHVKKETSSIENEERVEICKYRLKGRMIMLIYTYWMAIFVILHL